jgi:hypothetical protein
MNLSTIFGNSSTTVTDISFSLTDLVNGIYTLAGTTVISAVVDENGRVVMPDIIYGTVNTTVDLTNYVSTMTGTWKIRFAQGTSSSGGGGGMWTLIKRWEPTEPSSGYTFSDLNGDTDRRYLMSAFCKLVSGSSTDLVAYLNGDETTNYQNEQMCSYGGNIISLSHTNGLKLGYVDAATSGTHSSCEIQGMAAYPKVCKVDFLQSINNPSSAFIYHAYNHGLWKNTSKITSIKVKFASGNIDVGSYIELWKLAQ